MRLSHHFVIFRHVIHFHHGVMRVYGTLLAMVLRYTKLYHFGDVSTLLVLALPVRGRHLFGVHFRLVVVSYGYLVRVLLDFIGIRLFYHHTTFTRGDVVDYVSFRASSLYSGRGNNHSYSYGRS